MQLPQVIKKPKIQFNNHLTVNNLKVRLKHNLIEYGNIQFEAGNSYIIKGQSGLGKSVFLKSITGLLPFQSGTILYDNKIIDNNCRNDVFTNIKMISASNTLFNDTVINNIF